jgi:Domain of unknown function (DUF6438)
MGATAERKWCGDTMPAMNRFPTICRVLAFTFLVAVANAGPVNAPIVVPGAEVPSHRIGNFPFIRLMLPPREAWELNSSLNPCVHVTVDSHGAVILATAGSHVPESLRLQTEASVEALKYHPFESNGHAVSATFDEYVTILPSELVPTRHISFPEVQDWDSLRITLTRGRCYGSCPAYRVEIHGDGAVLFRGEDGWVAVPGKQRGSISREAVRELVGRFRDTDYYSLNDEYNIGAFDVSTIETSIEIDGNSKKVKDSGGLETGMPMSVHALERAIDEIANTDQWTRFPSR